MYTFFVNTIFFKRELTNEQKKNNTLSGPFVMFRLILVIFSYHTKYNTDHPIPSLSLL